MAMRPGRALVAVLAGVILLAMVTTFAIEISNTQTHNRDGVRARVHERGILAGALIDGLFDTVTQSQPQYARMYGGRGVSAATLDRERQTAQYLAVLSPHGRLLATSRGLPAGFAAHLARDLSVRMARRGRPYGLGNVLSSPVGPVMNFAVPFRTSYGTRILVTGFRPRLMGLFLAGDLRKIPGVRGSVNYVIDGNGMVLASTARRTPPGARFTGPFPRGDQTHLAREAGGRYYDEVRLADSGWRIVLESPDGPLYAGVSGLSKWLPWGLFGAFALVGLLAAWLVGRVLAAAAQARDANARLATLNAELETSNRLLSERARELARSNEELDQFASIASHDLQEPLRKVRTFTEQLTRQESERLSEKGQDYLRRANAAAARMQTLIEDLLRFSRVSTHARRPTEVDLGAVARDVLEDLSATIGAADARVHLDELPVVMAESAQMRQLLQNLVSNAVKFAAKDRRPEVWVTSEIAGDELRLSVRDNGIGFDARHAERIFGVFERLHGRGDYPGTGIGLALCRKIVERHGGTITAEARPGEGATLTVTLPRDNSGVHPAPSRPAGRPRPGSGHPVLEGAHV